MKIVSFRINDTPSYGVTDGKSVIDVGRALRDRFPTLRDVLQADALSAVEAVAAERTPDYMIDEIEILQPITNPDMIICVGMNYVSAFDEVGKKFLKYPSLFMRRATAQTGHKHPINKPTVTDIFDCEAELAVIIGRPGREIATELAMDHIAGYSIFNDASAVDWMEHTSQNVTPGKNFDRSGAFGPWLVTKDEIPDPTQLKIVHKLNGATIQNGPVSDMCYSIPQLISYISTFTTLQAGDVISTGSPGGIRSRRRDGKYVKVGDVVEINISQIGTLENSVA